MSADELKRRNAWNFMHHPPDQGEADDRHQLHNAVREILRVAADELVDYCSEGRELSLALTKLEEAMMWANAAIARGEKALGDPSRDTPPDTDKP